MKNTALNVKSHSELAYDRLKENIITGVYSSGQLLNERQISDELGISRTPVREALQRLSIEGWMINEPYKRNQVRQFTFQDIVDAQKVRSALEVLAIDQAMDSLQDADFKSMAELIEEQKQSADKKSFILIDRSFHEFIFAKSNNQLLQSILQQLNDIIRYFGLLAILDEKRIPLSIAEHQTIVDAIQRGDKTDAMQAMRRHMENTTSAILRSEHQSAWNGEGAPI